MRTRKEEKEEKKWKIIPFIQTKKNITKVKNEKKEQSFFRNRNEMRRTKKEKKE